MNSIFASSLHFEDPQFDVHYESQPDYGESSLSSASKFSQAGWTYNYDDFNEREKIRRKKLRESVINFLEDKRAFEEQLLSKLMGDDLPNPLDSFGITKPIVSLPSAVCTEMNDLEQLGLHTQSLSINEEHYINSLGHGANLFKEHEDPYFSNHIWGNHLEQFPCGWESPVQKSTPRSWAERATLCPRSSTPNKPKAAAAAVVSRTRQDSKVTVTAPVARASLQASSSIDSKESNGVREKLMWEIFQENVSRSSEKKKKGKGKQKSHKNSSVASVVNLTSETIELDSEKSDRGSLVLSEVKTVEDTKLDTEEELQASSSCENKKLDSSLSKELASSVEHQKSEECASNKRATGENHGDNFKLKRIVDLSQDDQVHNTLHIHKLEKQRALWKELIEKETSEQDDQKNRQKWLRKDTEKNYRKKLEAERRAKEKFESILEKRQEKEKVVEEKQAKKEKKTSKQPKRQATKLKHERKKH